MPKLTTLILALTLTTVVVIHSSASVEVSQSIDVRSYVVRISPDLAKRTVSGSVDITFVAMAALTQISFESGHLIIDAAATGDQSLRFTQAGQRVTLDLPAPLGPQRSATITLKYHGAPSRGVTFIGEPQQIYTAFTTSEWMVGIDDPSDKATLDLTVSVPSEWTVFSHGDPVGGAAAEVGRRAYRFLLTEPASTYTYGFVAGRFSAVVQERVGNIQLQYVGTDTDEATMRRVFADTPDMLRFFEDRAGVPYPAHAFTQVLTAGGAQQELSGLVLLPKTYAPWVAEHPQDITLAAHELAHQWWGNRVTCQSWNEFWLNEGMATFMAAAYVEHRFGRDAYDRLIAGYRADYERIRDAGHDKPLVFADWSRPSADDRTLVYRKGAYVLAQLRDTIGDAAFWAGLRAYTRQFDGKSVVSDDLRVQMERASGRDLAPFFSQWVSAR